MTALKAIFLLVAIVSVPAVCVFLIRLSLKLSRSVDEVNRTLRDARPQLNVFLVNLNKAAEEINLELENLTVATGEIRDLLTGLESGLEAVEKALRSPLARWGSALAATAAGKSILRRVLHPRG